MVESKDINQSIYINHGVTTPEDDTLVSVAVRPEKIEITREKPTQEHNWAEGVVSEIAYLGGHSVYYIKLPSGKVVQSTFSNVERKMGRPTWDDKVYISWESESGVVLTS